MNTKPIKIIEAGDAKYLGEIPGFDDLPDNCLFNKKITGSGGTSVALSNQVPYVLCMPYTSLIQNKMEWCNARGVKVLSVYKGAANESDIKEFAGDKIMVTYDSLKKVVRALGERAKEFKLLVDEYHLLINSGSFRYNAVNEVLDLFKEFGSYVFMTATPTNREYMPRILQELPMTTVNWECIRPVTIDYSVLEQKLLYPTVAGIAHKYHLGEYKGNAYFFLNSVRAIIDISTYLKKLEVPSQELRIICANTEVNNTALSLSLGQDYYVSTASDIPKKINFLTSTVFEGSDLFDQDGVTYIISDGKRPHTKYDIMTTVPQIIGRIRDSQYKHWAKIMFSPSGYFSYTTEEEFAENVKEQLEEARTIVDDYNIVKGPTKKTILESALNSPFLVLRNEKLEVNETAMCAEMQHYSALHKTYYVPRDSNGKPIQKKGSSKKEINGVPYLMNSIPAGEFFPDRVEIYKMGVGKLNFRELVDAYNQFTEGFQILSASNEKKKKLIEGWFPLIPEAFEKIGYERITALKYNQRRITAEILLKQNLSNPAKVRKLLSPYTYGIGRRISLEKIKADLQEAYQLLGIDRTAKASDLKSIFKVAPCKIRLNNQRENGYRIIGLI